MSVQAKESWRRRDQNCINLSLDTGKKQWTSKIKWRNSVSSVFDICSRRRGGLLLHWMCKNLSQQMVSQAWVLQRWQGRLRPPKCIKGGLIPQAVTSECTSRAQFLYHSRTLLGNLLNPGNIAKFWKLVKVQLTWGGGNSQDCTHQASANSCQIYGHVYYHWHRPRSLTHKQKCSMPTH